MVDQIKRWRYGLEVLGVRSLKRLLQNFDWDQLETLAEALGVIAMGLDARGRKTAQTNLESVLGITDVSARGKMVQSCYRNFARTFLSLFWLSGKSKEDIARDYPLQWERPEDELRARQGPVIWMSPHYGCYETLVLSACAQGFPLMVVAQEFKNSDLTVFFSDARGATGAQMVPQRMAMLKLLRHLDKGGHAALLPDLSLKPESPAVIVSCFERWAAMTSLHVRIQERTGASFAPMIARVQQGKMQCRILPLISALDKAEASQEQIRERVQAVWDVFEAEILKHPEEWLWMYKQWRYLPTPSEGRKYPSYANRSKLFDRFLKSQV